MNQVTEPSYAASIIDDAASIMDDAASIIDDAASIKDDASEIGDATFIGGVSIIDTSAIINIVCRRLINQQSCIISDKSTVASIIGGV